MTTTPPSGRAARRTVRHNPERDRYEIELDDVQVGFAEYARHDGRVTFTHTEVGPAYGGRGLATELAHFALDEALEQDVEVIPLCSFVRKIIADDPELYLALVPESERARFDL